MCYLLILYLFGGYMFTAGFRMLVWSTSLSIMERAEKMSTRNCSRCCGMATKLAILQQAALHPLTSFLLTSWRAFEVVFRIETWANTTTSTRPRRQKMSTTSPGVTSRVSSGQHHRKLAQNVVRNRQRNLTRPYWTEQYRTEQLCSLLKYIQSFLACNK